MGPSGGEGFFVSVIQADQKHGGSYRVGLVTSLFNGELTRELERGALSCLANHGLEPMARVYVPGAMEIPLAVQTLLGQKDCDGVVALGVVIRGETSHYECVCHAVERGCSQVQLQLGKPVGFGVLTTENALQARSRCGGSKGHKGFEAARTVLDMLHILDGIKKIETTEK